MEKIKQKLILIHHPTILTQDEDWLKSISKREIKEEGEILLLPEDAIIVVHKEDQDTIRKYNNPLFIIENNN